MKYKTIRKEVVREHTSITRTTCDGCGKNLLHGSRRYDGSSNEVNITAVTGDNWPSGDSRQFVGTDCCPDCFFDKVKPALESMGFRFIERSNDEDEADYAQWDELEKKQEFKC